MITLAKDHRESKKEVRKAYCDAMIEAAKTQPELVAINCDLCSSMGMTDFAKAYPERAFNVGIQESNGVGIAAGFAAVGLIPFFHSFAVFSSRRVFDQVFLSCGYAKRNVKIIGGDAGVSATVNGGTHMAFEDMALMRTIPGARVLDVCDDVMAAQLVPQLVAHYGVDYMRMPRKKVWQIYEEGSRFAIGRANVLREGTDVSLIASGLLVHEALQAAEQLQNRGVSARVVDMFTVKPIDVECVVESAQKTGAVVTAENHNIIGGLGSAVAEVLAEHCPVPLRRVGVQDEFGEVGSQEYLMRRFGLTADVIAAKALEVMAHK